MANFYGEKIDYDLTFISTVEKAQAWYMRSGPTPVYHLGAKRKHHLTESTKQNLPVSGDLPFWRL